jgi:hypothetical protein
MRCRFLLTLIILFPFTLFTQPVLSAPSQDSVTFYPGATIRFEQITIENGLSQNAILA